MLLLKAEAKGSVAGVAAAKGSAEEKGSELSQPDICSLFYLGKVKSSCFGLGFGISGSLNGSVEPPFAGKLLKRSTEEKGSFAGAFVLGAENTSAVVVLEANTSALKLISAVAAFGAKTSAFGGGLIVYAENGSIFVELLFAGWRKSRPLSGALKLSLPNGISTVSA